MSDIVTGRELADRLNVNERSLRAVIREEGLVTGKRPEERYALTRVDQSRIAAHPRVRGLPRSNR